MSWTWLVLLIYTSLSTYRLTRLVVKDDFPLVAIPRRWVIGDDVWDPDRKEWVPGQKHQGTWYAWFGELISCPWCASGWIALALTILVALSPTSGTLVEWLLLWLATWALGSTAAAKVG